MTSTVSSCRRCSLGNVGVSSTPQILQQQYPHQHAVDSDNDARHKKHSSNSLVNTRAYWPYPSAAAIAAVSGGVLPVECQSPGACSSSLEFEAMAAVHRLSVAVRDISVSEMLPRTSQLIFVNVTTLEGQPYCLELTAKGWRITSLRTDCMQGDFTRMELFTVYYESVYDLMSVISPSFKQHAAVLASRKSRSSCGDEESEYGCVDQELIDGELDSYHNVVKSSSASRKQSLTQIGNEPNVIQMCPQCCCISLTTPNGEPIADVVLDHNAAADDGVSASLLPFTSANMAVISNQQHLSDGSESCSCRCGSNHCAVLKMGTEENFKFPRRKLRNISEKSLKADEGDSVEAGGSSSSGDELTFSVSDTRVENGRASRKSRHAQHRTTSPFVSSRSSAHPSSSSMSSQCASHSSRSD